MVDIVKEMGDKHSNDQLANILQKILDKSQRSDSEQIKMVIYASRITNRVPAMSARFAINKFSAATKSTVITPVKISASYWLISPWKISSATVSASLEPAAT